MGQWASSRTVAQHLNRMDETLHALGKLLIESVPTAIFFILLTAYLRYVFFRPFAAMLDQRRKATEGVRQLAQQAFEAADKKTSEFQRALDLARAEIHKEHEAMRRQWSDEHTTAIAQARAEATRQIEEARAEIERETERAQAELDANVDSLSERIVESLLRRRAA